MWQTLKKNNIYWSKRDKQYQCCTNTQPEVEQHGAASFCWSRSRSVMLFCSDGSCSDTDIPDKKVLTMAQTIKQFITFSMHILNDLDPTLRRQNDAAQPQILSLGFMVQISKICIF
jgi:hypothetical protein